MSDNVKEMPQPHFCVDRKDSVAVISVKDVRDIAGGQISIAEHEDPEDVARTIACIAMDSLRGD